MGKSSSIGALLAALTQEQTDRDHKHVERAPTKVEAGSPVHTLLKVQGKRIARHDELADIINDILSELLPLTVTLEEGKRDIADAMKEQFPDGSECFKWTDENEVIFFDHEDDQPKWAKYTGSAN